jgi:hypothetical protein
MVQVYSEYNGAMLTDAQIEQIQGALIADLNAMAADDEPGNEPEAG